ncbi:Protocadherin Fat 4 [Manis pentadactyla]|nr:Protocadherin Fat 4 [Manis pentadactyla]
MLCGLDDSEFHVGVPIPDNTLHLGHQLLGPDRGWEELLDKSDKDRVQDTAATGRTKDAGGPSMVESRVRLERPPHFHPTSHILCLPAGGLL